MMIKTEKPARKQKKNVEEHEEHDQELPRPTITHWSTHKQQGAERAARLSLASLG